MKNAPLFTSTDLSLKFDLNMRLSAKVKGSSSKNEWISPYAFMSPWT
jgi:hypothetical protein